MLTMEQARQELTMAAQMNPGPWERHSLSTAQNAMLIAQKVPGMDSEKAYVLGLLHDIGRRVGVTGMRHSLDGYTYMMSLGQPDVATVCITHSYPTREVGHFEGKHDCTPEEVAFMADFIAKREFDDYDRLIQLCDAVSLPEGACIMEKRFVDVALRYGAQDYTIKRWRCYLEEKKYFDALCGCDIYTLLPNVFENSITNLI